MSLENTAPSADRDVMDADAPIFIKAVDYDVNGCDYLVMASGEVRPLPLWPEGPVRPQPAQ